MPAETGAAHAATPLARAQAAKNAAARLDDPVAASPTSDVDDAEPLRVAERPLEVSRAADQQK
jgi:hypothetical protein